MIICDHLNLTGTTPLLGAPKFIDMTDVYSRAWRERFARVAKSSGIALHEGDYAGLLGPQEVVDDCIDGVVGKARGIRLPPQG